MKTVILCGGYGTRLSEETVLKPKPMVEIGGAPILWHVMNCYWAYRVTDFYLALGYKSEVIKDYFLNYYNRQSDLSVSLATGEIQASKNCQRDWMVHMIDTGLNTMTGGRVRRLRDYLKDGPFMLTYGDGVADVDIDRLLDFHRSHGRIATVTAVRPCARFGGMTFDGDRVVSFKEKSPTGQGYINGGFFVFEPGIFDYIDGDDTILEQDPLERLTQEDQLMAFKHEGFWHCMDTIRDRNHLESLWESGQAPWKRWE